MGFLEVAQGKFSKEGPWVASCPGSYRGLLFAEDALKAEAARDISIFLDAPFDNFALQITVEGVPLLCGIFYDEQTVRFASPGLRRELLAVSIFQDGDTIKDLESFAKKFTDLDSQKAPSEHRIATLKGRLPKLLEGNDQDYRYGDTVKAMKTSLEQLLDHINDYKPTLFERVSDYILDLTTSYEPIRIHLLKFVAILPSLDHDRDGGEVKRMLLESLDRICLDPATLPKPYVSLFRLIAGAVRLVPPKPVGFLARLAIRSVAGRFIAGKNVEQADAVISSLSETGRDATLDRLGELVVSKKEADGYRDEVLKLIEGLSLHYPQGERNKAGINRAHVSIKVSALCSDFKPHAFDYTYADTAPRLAAILKAASRESVFVQIDAEHYFHRDTVWSIYKKILLETPDLGDYADTGIVLQAYLRDAHTHLAELEALAEKRNLTMPVRLVKGAYWDAETVEARALGFNAPEFLNKEETDLNFRQLALKILEYRKLQLCPASHNFSDHAFCELLRERHFPDSPPLEHQCLHMTYEALSVGMARMGWTVRNYVPVGPLIVGMSYLARRIMENSSQVGVLTAMRSHKTKNLPPSPEVFHTEKAKRGEIAHDSTRTDFTEDFANHPPVRLYVPEEYQAVRRALEGFAQNDLGRDYPHAEALSGAQHRILSPSDTGICVGTTTFATKDDVGRIVEAAHKSYGESDWPLPSSWQNRVVILLEAASIMAIDRLRLASLIVYESGKSVPEALGDVDEAIDFLDFYAREEKRLQSLRTLPSRGIVASIAPWNFPLAIPCGMLAASLAAGNTVVFKPAEQSPLTAWALVDILHRAGVPKDVLLYLPGEGDIGAALVADSRISMVVFTGSKDVGLEIRHKAGQRVYTNKRTGRSYPTSSIVETGGKNGIIVTDNAELDETVSGILYSAFGHAGQKCSACSRVIVSKNIEDKLIARLKEAVEDLKVGRAWDFATSINPLITEGDKKRIQRQARESVAEARQHGGRVIVERTGEELPGNLVGPALFQLPKKRAFDEGSFLRREVFGPLLYLVSYGSLEEAVEIFNANDYALTGGIFSQSQDDIDFLSERMESGNIYINRTITGARIAVEPFGGFKLSGTGPKAGSHYYVGAFHHRADPSIGRRQEGQSASKESLAAPKAPKRKSCPTGRLLKALELLSQGLGDSYRDVLFYYGWASKHLEAFSKTKEPNRPIAGQISFNDYTLVQKHTLLVSYSDSPHIRALFYLFSALGLGMKVTVVASTASSHAMWTKIGEFFKAAGFSKTFFSVHQGDENAIRKYLQDPHFETVVADGEIGDIETLCAVVFDGEGKRMHKLLTAFDGPDLSDIPSFVRAFTKPRSFAVNTMRHGVPMA